MYLVGSVSLRLMAMTFLFPVIAKFTLAVVRPGYYEALVARDDFAFRLGFDVILVILGVSLLFRSTAQSLLGVVDARAVAITRALVMSALTSVAILLTLHTLKSLGAIDALTHDGVMMISVGFWLVFFTSCIFPGWYRKRVWPRETAPAPAEVSPAFLPEMARFLSLPRKEVFPARQPRARRTHAPQTRHMGLAGWVATLSIVALLGVLGLGGVHGTSAAHFLPNASHVAAVERFMWPLGVICAVLLVLFVVIGPRPTRKTAFGSPFWRTVAAVAVFYFGFYLSADPALRLGLPDIMAQAQGGDVVTYPATVVARDQNYRRHKCNRTALVRMDVENGVGEYLICDIPQPLWGQLARGNRLDVSGVRTPYGFRYDTITRR